MIESDAFFGLNGVTEFKLGNNDVEIRLGEKLIYPIPQEMRMLTFVATETGTFKFSGNSVNYSVDNGVTWIELASDADSPTVPAGGKIMFKATLTPASNKGVGKFSSTGRFTAQGNVMSLLYGDNFIGQTSLSGKDYAFYGLFRNCTGLTSADNISLPATTLASSCYGRMFQYCTSLATAPELPATTLANNCYEFMFHSCSLLTTTPELPATTLANTCYQYMFGGCDSLTTAPSLPATTLASGCYYYMFIGCTSLTNATSLSATTLAYQCYSYMFYNCTSLTTAPVLPATTLTSSCYQNMFRGCTSLTTAPSLPATTLASICYGYMFYGCISLTTAPSLPATTLATNCYQNMFNGCTSLTAAPSLPATTLATNCYQYMFYGCISLTNAPVLPATTLADYCYQYMFYGCTSLTTASLPATTLATGCYTYMFYGCTNLNSITCLATNISASVCTSNWVNGVAASGTFIKDPSMTSWTTGINGIPTGWVVRDYVAPPTLVDLGLPSGTKWADRNIGAGAPEGNGLYFSWGNVEGHEKGSGYDFGTSNDGPYASTPGASLTGHIPVNATYDAARANLGGSWRMPTTYEIMELYYNCTSVWGTLNGVYGRLFTSDINGNSVFFPAAGGYIGTSLNREGAGGSYWSSSLYSQTNAYYLDFNSSDVYPQSYYANRSDGFPVRAVQ